MSDTQSIHGFLRYEEAAKLLGISASTLRRKVMLHQIPFARPFGMRSRVLFDEEVLRDFVRSKSVAPIAPAA